MPELPEVETVRRGLARLIPAGTRIERVRLLRPDLRAPLPPDLPRRLAGTTVLGFRRHGKFLLWDTAAAVVVNHLGMTGSWREVTGAELDVHDHVTVHLAGDRVFAFRDPRRFGYLGVARPGAEWRHPALRDLGPDALDRERFTPDYLRARFRGRRAVVKALLLDQGVVAGVGNIYAAEALHGIGVRPRRPAGKLSAAALAALVGAIRSLLLAAIDAGGSTFRDFRAAEGGRGTFQERFRVYGRAGEPCLACESLLCEVRISGRGSVYCPRCQR